MVEIATLLCGVLGTLATLALIKIVDIILEHFLNKTIFGRIWSAMTRSLKKFRTRLNPIVIRFQFRAQLESNDPLKVKEGLAKLIESLSEKYKGKIVFSPIKWTDTDRTGSVNATFNNREFRIDMDISSEYRDYDPEKGIFEAQEAFEVSESVAFSIEVNFPLQSIDPMLLSLSSLTNFITEQLKEMHTIIKFSKGLFTLAPIKADLTMDHWIKEKQFDVSLLLKARDNILVNLYPKKAEIVFPTLQIDEKVSEYLEATILNYYL